MQPTIHKTTVILCFGLFLLAFQVQGQEDTQSVKAFQSGFSLGIVHDHYRFGDGSIMRQSRPGAPQVGIGLGIHNTLRITDFVSWRSLARLTFHNRDIYPQDRLLLFRPDPPVTLDVRMDFPLSLPAGKLSKFYFAPGGQLSVPLHDGSLAMPPRVWSASAGIGYEIDANYLHILPELSYHHGFTNVNNVEPNNNLAYLSDFRLTVYFRGAKTTSK